ncbi:MAG: hypothetical protein H7Y61_04775 [Rhizobiales bacterium]|nr:hypothetical protein [Rhizobacter sp.]
MSADKDRAVRRQKQKRAKDSKKRVGPSQPAPAAVAASPVKKRAAKTTAE